MTAINTYISEMQQKWILGAEDPEKTFDEYIQRVKAMGIEEQIAIVQSAYDRYIGK